MSEFWRVQRSINWQLLSERCIGIVKRSQLYFVICRSCRKPPRMKATKRIHIFLCSAHICLSRNSIEWRKHVYIQFIMERTEREVLSPLQNMSQNTSLTVCGSAMVHSISCYVHATNDYTPFCTMISGCCLGRRYSQIHYLLLLGHK